MYPGKCQRSHNLTVRRVPLQPPQIITHNAHNTATIQLLKENKTGQNRPDASQSLAIDDDRPYQRITM